MPAGLQAIVGGLIAVLGVIGLLAFLPADCRPRLPDFVVGPAARPRCCQRCTLEPIAHAPGRVPLHTIATPLAVLY
jgi:hypothetical protein